MAAVVGSVKGALTGEDLQKRVGFGNVEPAILSLMKHISPLLAVLMLFASALVCNEVITRPLLGVALLTLIIASPIFARSNRDSSFASQPLSKTYSRILLHWVTVVAVLLFLGFAFKMTSEFSRQIMLTWFAATPVALFLGHSLRRRVQATIANGPSAHRYIIVGANNVGFELFRRLPQAGFLGFFDFRSADRLSKAFDTERLVGHCKDIASFVRKNGITSVYIALPISKVPRIGEMVRELRDTTASIYFLPDVFAFDLIQGRLVDIHGMPALSVCDTPFHGMDAVLKRLFDLLVGGVALAFAAPVMAVIAAGVKLSSPGPVLFRQRRYGLNGEQINVYKFRSMTVCEDGSDVRQATKNDQRVTPFGGFLRRTSLDELPQLFNVLQGKMSLVGPRPHAVAHNEQYRKLISGYMIRHKVRPGITGLAQVNGLRGETDTLDKMSGRITYDIEYLNNWSVWLDIKIMFRTVMLLVRRDQNAY